MNDRQSEQKHTPTVTRSLGTLDRTDMLSTISGYNYSGGTLPERRIRGLNIALGPPGPGKPFTTTKDLSSEERGGPQTRMSWGGGNAGKQPELGTAGGSQAYKEHEGIVRTPVRAVGPRPAGAS